MNSSRISRTVLLALVIISLLLPVVQVPGLSAEGGAYLTYEYHFPAPEVDLTSEERQFVVGDLEKDTRSGVPTLPVQTLLLALPVGTGLLEVDVRHSEPFAVEIVSYYPRNPVESSLEGYDAEGCSYDPVTWELAGTYVLEGVEIVCLNLRPLQWHEGTGRLLMVNDYSVTLTLEETSIGATGNMDVVREIVDNPEDVLDLPDMTGSELLPDGSYQYLIITDESLSSPFQSLADWKAERNYLGSVYENIRSIVVTLDQIRSEPSFWGTPSSHGGTGNDTQTLVRNYLIAAHAEWGVEYVLIGGDDDIVPTRRLYAPGSTEFEYLPGDIYYTGLDGDWDNDGDGVYGEPYHLTELGPGALGEEADLLAEVYVGRATVSTVQEAWNFVNKTMLYERSYVNQYSTDLLFVGERLDTNPTYGDDYKKEVYDTVLADEGLDLTTLYARDGTFSDDALLAQLESGAHVMNHMGHGNYISFAELDINEVRSLDNDLPFVVYTQACMVAGFDEKADEPGDSIAEEFIKQVEGAVAFIGNSRYGWYQPGGTGGTSQKFDISFFSQVYDDGVTNLGKALSLSKQEWIGYASSDDLTRWVYMELNLLGDPETNLLLSTVGEHDLGVVEVDTGSGVLGETSLVSVRVQNLGQNPESGSVRLLVEGVEVDDALLSLSPGESVWKELSWVPLEHRFYNISLDVVCAVDGVPENDRSDLTVLVDRRLTSDELWETDTELLGGLIIDPGTVLRVRDCNVTFRDADQEYGITVLGSLLAEDVDFGGSAYFICSEEGNLEFGDCDVDGLSASSSTALQGGTLKLNRTEVIGGAGWTVDDTVFELIDSMLIDQTSEWMLTGSILDIDGLHGEGGYGIRLCNVSGAVRNSSWSEGEMGMSVERSSGLLLHNLSFTGNHFDIGMLGDNASHFVHDIEDVRMTHGSLTVIVHEDNITIEGASGSLYLVDCQDVLVKGCRYQNAGIGLALIDCERVEVLGNAMENCSVGLMAIGSTGRVWSNDLLTNEEQTRSEGSTITFDNGYPAGGNHWSDLEGEDVRSGEGQDLEGGDGVLDSPYHEGDVIDRYPKVSLCSIVHDMPEAGFTMNVQTADRVSPVVFTATGPSGSGIANWTWDLGDGAVAYGESVDHTYSVLGTMQVRLTIVDHKGLNDSCVREISVLNALPYCEFSYSPSQPRPGESVVFTDLSSDIDGGVASWDWDFGDGESSDLASPSHTFTTEGDYYVTLEIVDGDGGSGSKVRKLAVGNEAPSANFSWSPLSMSTLQDVQFTSQCTDPDGLVVSWSWDFGDGSFGEGSSVKHRYSSIGTYHVVLMVTDDDGAKAAASAILTVVNARPVVTFSCPSEVMSLEEVEFIDRSFDPDGRIRSWSWDFGDGGRSTSASPCHTYLRPGVYEVALTVIDNLGSSTTGRKVLTVLNRLPDVSLIAPGGERWSLEPIELSAIAADQDGEVVRYDWDMGDGSLLEGDHITYAYTAPGNYTVVLTCTDDAGGETSQTSWLLINNLLPHAIILTEQSMNHSLEMSFMAMAGDDDGSVIDYDWSFGDGSCGQGPSVVHRYAIAGQYQVNLTVTDDHGGVVETTFFVTVSNVNISLHDPHITFEEERGWVFTAAIINDGDVPVMVTLIVTADGNEYARTYSVNESWLYVDMILTNFTDGEVAATLEVPQGWDADPDDNLWTGTVSRTDASPYWFVGIAVVVLAVAAIALVRGRRRG